MNLSSFINTIQYKNHEIIFEIDANEGNEKPKNGVAELLQPTKLIYVISEKHGICKESDIYMRG